MTNTKRKRNEKKREVVDVRCHYLTPPPFISEQQYLFTKTNTQKRNKNNRENNNSTIQNK
jgi:hypothetical protein